MYSFYMLQKQSVNVYMTTVTRLMQATDTRH